MGKRRLIKTRGNIGGFRMRVVRVLTVIIAVGMFVGSAMAVPPGKTADWSTSAGKVIFDGKVHADKGLKCSDCHVKIFKMKKGSTVMTMADINKGKFCGECHNGQKAFKSDDPANCNRCHKK